MKYIRTKDRVCEFEMELLTMPDLIAVKGECIGGFIRKEDIVKQADTIEELCDEFVVIRDNDKYVCDYIGEELYYLATEHDGDGNYFSKKELLDLIVYGAIWTDKGLIYVAKMNDKGEFELL